MADKRCYNKSEAIHYFGINLSAFETYIEPELEGKGIKVGSCLVYEAYDLDKAWEAFKRKAKGEASASANPLPPPPVALKKTRARSKEAMPSPDTGSAAWNAAVKTVLEKGRSRRK